jgi:hypothetical protein
MCTATICIGSVGTLVRAGQPYLVSASAGGSIWRIQDSNNDGDAFDVGERILWGDGFVGARGMTVVSPAVYVTEEGLADGSNQVVRLIDSNNDGDALDIGERTIWVEGLDDPRDVSFDVAGASYLSEFDDNQVWRLIDLNDDGDALDIGERVLYADGIAGSHMILPRAGELLVTAETGGQIHRLVDLNGDGDALDVTENLPITPDYGQLVGIIDGGSRLYFSSLSTDTVYRAQDNNGDGDMLDIGEVLSFADSVFGLIDGPSGLASFDDGGFLAADTNNGQVKLVRDFNGDGDALDLGEVVAFSDGINAPVDIALVPFVVPGDFNRNGTVDAADYVVWRKGLGTILTQYDLNIWRANFGQEFVSSASATDYASATAGSQLGAVPEPATSIALLFAAVALCVRERRPEQKTASTH